MAAELQELLQQVRQLQGLPAEHILRLVPLSYKHCQVVPQQKEDGSALAAPSSSHSCADLLNAPTGSP